MKNKQNKELAICGIAAVKALVKEHPEKIRRFYFNTERVSMFGQLCKYLAQNRIPYNKVENIDLEKLSGTVHHQGAVAMIDVPEIPQLTSDIVNKWVEKKENAVLLDCVGNANNLGAIIRSAVFFGITNIIIPMNDSQSSITTSTYRVAQGGMEYVQVYTVRSTARFLQDVNGRMIRIGTDVRAKETVSSLENCKNKPSIIILGNEEFGISDVVKENCDKLVVIPSYFMKKRGNSKNQPVESLNVAQASSIIFYELSKSF